MEALLLPPMPLLLNVDTLDPRRIERLMAFLGRQKEGEERMFSRLLLLEDDGLGKSSAAATKTTEKEV